MQHQQQLSWDTPLTDEEATRLGISSSERRRYRPSVLLDQAQGNIGRARKLSNRLRYNVGIEKRVLVNNEKQASYKRVKEISAYMSKWSTVRPNFPPAILKEFAALGELATKLSADTATNQELFYPEWQSHQEQKQRQAEAYNLPSAIKEREERARWEQELKEKERQTQKQFNIWVARLNNQKELKQKPAEILQYWASFLSPTDKKRLYRINQEQHPILIARAASRLFLTIYTRYTTRASSLIVLKYNLIKVLNRSVKAMRQSELRSGTLGKYEDRGFEKLEKVAMENVFHFAEDILEIEEAVMAKDHVQVRAKLDELAAEMYEEEDEAIIW